MSAQACVVPAPITPAEAPSAEGLYKYPVTTRAPKPRLRAASISRTARSRHEPQPRLSVSTGVCVPSVSLLWYDIWAATPLLRSANSADVSVVLLLTHPR